MNDHHFECHECKVVHDLYTKDGLIDTIAHKVFHERRDFGMGSNGEADKSFATRIFDEFEKIVPNTKEWKEWMEDNSRFEGYFKMYEEHKMRTQWPV